MNLKYTKLWLDYNIFQCVFAVLRFGQIFFKAERTLSMDELQANFLVSNVEKDGLIDVSKPLGSTYWTFVTA